MFKLLKRLFGSQVTKTANEPKLTDVYLHRIKETREVTLGLLVMGDDKPLCVTLEEPDLDNARRISNIPEGSYEVVSRYSDKFKQHWHVQGVPNRDLILFHKGNSTKDTQGCILVGMGYGAGLKTITRSKVAFEKLHRVLPSSFTLHVTNMMETDIIAEV